MAPTIRRYAGTDHDAVYDICVRTAAAGGDARGQYGSDDLMPDLFAGPYVFLEPESAFVLVSDFDESPFDPVDFSELERLSWARASVL